MGSFMVMANRSLSADADVDARVMTMDGRRREWIGFETTREAREFDDVTRDGARMTSTFVILELVELVESREPFGKATGGARSG